MISGRQPTASDAFVLFGALATSPPRSSSRRCTRWSATDRSSFAGDRRVVVGLEPDDLRAAATASAVAVDEVDDDAVERSPRRLDLRRRRLPRRGQSSSASPRCVAGVERPRTTWRSRRACSTVVEGLADVGLRKTARRRREAVRARSPVGRSSTTCSTRAFPEAAHLPHRPLPRQGVGREPPRLPVRQLDARADLEPQLRAERPDHDGRDFGVQGRGRFYEEVGALRDVVQNHLLQIAPSLAMEPPVGGRCRRAARREGTVFRQIRTLDPGDVVRGQFNGYATRRAWPDSESRPSPPCASRSTRGAGPGSLPRSGRARPADHRHRGWCASTSRPASSSPQEAATDTERPAVPARQGRRRHPPPPGQGARRQASSSPADRPRCDLRWRVRRRQEALLKRLLVEGRLGGRPRLRRGPPRSRSSGAWSAGLLEDPARSTCTRRGVGARGRRPPGRGRGRVAGPDPADQD